jgi:hypothetical protein
MSCPFDCQYINCTFNIKFNIFFNIFTCGENPPTQEPPCSCGCEMPFQCSRTVSSKAIPEPPKKSKSPKTDKSKYKAPIISTGIISKRKAPEDCPNMNWYCSVTGKYNTKIEKICKHPQCRTA